MVLFYRKRSYQRLLFYEGIKSSFRNFLELKFCFSDSDFFIKSCFVIATFGAYVIEFICIILYFQALKLHQNITAKSL